MAAAPTSSVDANQAADLPKADRGDVAAKQLVRNPAASTVAAKVPAQGNRAAAKEAASPKSNLPLDLEQIASIEVEPARSISPDGTIRCSSWLPPK